MNNSLRTALRCSHRLLWVACAIVMCGLAFVCAIPTQVQSQSADAPPAAAAAPAIQPSDNPSQAKPGSISGTVVDKDGAFVPNATIVLTSGTFTVQMQSGGDGSFAFANVPPGPFEVSFAARGFATQKKSAVLLSGGNYTLPQVQLVVADTIEVEVTQTREEIAEEQMHVEEQQRVFGVIPNFYVSYIPDAAPLDTRQKFKLGWKSTFDPVSIGLVGAVAGFEQATNAYSGFGQGAQGYGKRFGAALADSVAGTFFGSVILPSVFKQDPRYFYKGTGSRRSRFFYAMANAVICKGDNGHWQPNYSNVLGALAAGGLSNLYYPAKNRNGVGLTFATAFIGVGATGIGAVIEEFFLHKATSHAPASALQQN